MAQIYRGVSAFAAGWILLGLMTALVLTSWWPVRRLLFNFFYKSHWILFLLSAVIAAVHGAAPVLAGAALWAADVLIRTVYMAGGQRPLLPSNMGTKQAHLLRPCAGTHLSHSPPPAIWCAICTTDMCNRLQK